MLPPSDVAWSPHGKHERAPIAGEYVPARQSLQDVLDPPDPPKMLHIAVKPPRVTLESDVKVTLRKPVSEEYSLVSTSDPECLRILSLEDEHKAELHR